MSHSKILPFLPKSWFSGKWLCLSQVTILSEIHWEIHPFFTKNHDYGRVRVNDWPILRGNKLNATAEISQQTRLLLSKIPQKIWKTSLPKKNFALKKEEVVGPQKTPGSSQRLGMRSNPPRPHVKAPWCVKWFSVFFADPKCITFSGITKKTTYGVCVFLIKLIDLRMVGRDVWKIQVPFFYF